MSRFRSAIYRVAVIFREGQGLWPLVANLSDPETASNITVSCNQHSLCLIPTVKNCLPSNPSNMKAKLLEQPNLNIDVED